MNIPKPVLFSFGLAICLFYFCLVSLGTHQAYAAVESHPAKMQPGPALTVSRTVGTKPNACASTNEVTIVPGAPVYECLTLTNSGSVSLSVHTLADTRIGGSAFVLALPIGETLVFTNFQPIFGQFVYTPTASVAHTTTLYATGADTVISDTAVSRVTMVGTQGDHLSFAQTLSTQADNCGTADSLGVQPGTPVHSCLFALNATTQTLTMTLATVPQQYLNSDLPLAPFIWPLAGGASAKLNTLLFTPTASIDGISAIYYDIGSSNTLSITTSTRVNVFKSVLHLPLVHNANTTPTCSIQSTTGSSFRFQYEAIPAGSIALRDGIELDAVSGSGTFFDIPGGAEGTTHNYAIANKGVILVGCGSVTVFDPPMPPIATCSVRTTTGTTYGFEFENIPADSTLERDGVEVLTIGGSGTFSVSVSGEDGTKYRYIITNGGVTIADCGTATVLNPPTPVRPTCNFQATTGTTFYFEFEAIPPDSVVERNGTEFLSISGSGTFTSSPGGEDGTMYEYVITNGGETITVCGTATITNPQLPVP